MKSSIKAMQNELSSSDLTKASLLTIIIVDTRRNMTDKASEEISNATTTTLEETAVASVPKPLTDPNWSVLDTFNMQDDTELFEEALIPPENFNMVCEHVYRSSFPKKKHYKFLEKLKLKSVLTLILEEYPEQNMKFLEERNIQFLQFGIAGNKEPFVQIPEDKISAALAALLDKRNHPILIHCNKGKHRTGCLVGCLRKIQNWSHTSIFDEYRRFSHPKSRSMDQQFIELYDAKQVWPLVDRRYLPNWPTLADPFY
ncbi:hypothetical protein [Parasitella parasitica]|uniref:diphosphoinositol-polyphosphate diphosphatase n=1 Tax=Parasitella parasitica TaxID=35722 RepID=A0A0B7NJ14_9FUNG|nr:hypothetical protein [Parasitella parasitica]